jgi:urease accessory protein
MRTGTILPAGRWNPAREVDRVIADYEGRHRRRVLMRCESGREILLDLDTARLLRDGDGLELPDGSVVRIVAAPEPLLEVRAANPLALMQLAWHLGNRHLAAAIEPDRILIRADHVIADMVRGLGGSAEAVEAPFNPETGAYAGHEAKHAHGHGHGHGHGHHDHHHSS